MEIADRYAHDFLLDGKYLDIETGKVEPAPFKGEDLIFRMSCAYNDFCEKERFAWKNEYDNGYKPNEMHIKIARKIINILETTKLTNTRYATMAFIYICPEFQGRNGLSTIRKKAISEYKFKDEKRYKKLTLRRANGKVKQRVLEYAKNAYAEPKIPQADLRGAE